MRFSSHGSPGHRPGGKRCPMAEIHKPDFDPRHPGGSGDIRFLLSSLLLVFMLFFGYQYISQLKPSAPISGSQMQSQMVHAEIAKGSSPVAGGQSVASPGNFGWLTFIAKPALPRTALSPRSWHRQLGLVDHRSNRDLQSHDYLAANDVDGILFEDDARSTQGRRS